ncbi:MAG: OmpA family protein [Acidobacteria bacterium]|nr:OmpA family protein [Acidobacteriota bacterium]
MSRFKSYWFILSLALILLAVFSATKTSATQEKPAFAIEGGRLKLPKPIIFATGTDKLLPESDAALNHIKAFLADKTSITLVRIEAHSDNQGQPATNQTLTEKRALAVAKWLVEHGVECKRLLPVGFGSTKPVAANDTPEGRAQNQRIEIAMAEMRGRAIGGMPTDGGGKIAGTVCPENK